MDASAVTPNLYVGSKPEPGRYGNVDAIVLCAYEYQPIGALFEGVKVIYAPLDDDPTRPLTPAEIEIAVSAARKVAGYLQNGDCVLVTCMQGCNRSNLVAGLSLMLAYQISGPEVVQMLRRARPCALKNPVFAAFISNTRAS